MKATVKEIAVFYGGQRYSKGEEVKLKKDDFDEALFVKVESDEEESPDTGDSDNDEDQADKGKSKGKKKSDKE